MTYRGVRIGRVDKLELTDEGVDVYLDIDNDHDDIPADAHRPGRQPLRGGRAVRRAAAEDRRGPYLKEGSEIAEADTRPPIQTDQLLTDISNTVSSVDQEALRTTVSEVGAAFAGAGEDLQAIIDSGNSFIEAADDNFDVTTALIEDCNTVLNGQVASDERAAHLRLAALGVQRGVRQLRRRPAPGHRHRLVHGQPAARLPGGQQGRPRRADPQPGHDRRGDPEAAAAASSSCWWSTPTSSRAASRWSPRPRRPGCTTPTSA